MITHSTPDWSMHCASHAYVHDVHATQLVLAAPTASRFCHSTLADWKQSLTPAALKPDVQKVQPIMVVYFEGEIHRCV